MKNIAVIGATGMVGRIMIKVLEEKKFPIKNFYAVASEKSIGKNIFFKKKMFKILSINEVLALNPDIALFSAGANISKEWAPKFAKIGTTVIDNSSAWRMDPTKKLIVPEVNGRIISKNDKIIANPNCSTIQLVLALYPLHKKYNIKRVVVSTYQSVSGSGKKAMDQLKSESLGFEVEKKYPYNIYKNILPHCDDFESNGYTKEELKLIKETPKIINDYNIKITATAVRVPVTGGHSESVNITFNNEFTINEIKEILSNMSGIVLYDNPKKNIYPMPIHAEGKNDVFVGRIRRDYSKKNSLNMWIVADNLRKGAATNAIQIAEIISKNI